MLKNKLAQLTQFQNAIVVEMFFFFFFKKCLHCHHFTMFLLLWSRNAVQHSPTDFTRWRLLHVTYSHMPYLFSLAISLTCRICCCVFLFFISRAFLYADFFLFYWGWKYQLSTDQSGALSGKLSSFHRTRTYHLSEETRFTGYHSVPHFSLCKALDTSEDVRKQTNKKNLYIRM